MSYVKDGFPVSKLHNVEYGGTLFSQLPEDVQTQVLNYEVSVDLLINLPDAEILDIFGRLNSYAQVLNEQEKINGTHFSAFKTLADKIGYKYNEYWIRQNILVERSILRMQEISLVADILISMLVGIKSKKQVKKYYDIHEKTLDIDLSYLENKFDDVIIMIGKLFPEGVKNTEFKRIHLFYSLFVTVAHCLSNIKHLNAPHVPLIDVASIERARNGLDRV